jgi:tetratricopeptide (TPR) repeat protein
MARHIIYLTNENLVSLTAHGGRIAARKVFPVSGAGQTEFEEHVRGLRQAPTHVITDLAVVYRNLQQPERSLALLDQAIGIAPDHWQAVYNKLIVLHFDLHRHDEAASALARLKEIKASNPEVPDLSSIEAEVMGS